jgi:uncharacterized RDD family membrane protein YckC
MRSSAKRKSANAAVPPLSLAPLWKRFVALIVDIAIGVAGIALAAVGALFVTEHNKWSRERVERLIDKLEGAKTRGPDLSDLILSTAPGVGLTMGVVRRNRQTYGQKLMRIRRVSADDGGPVTVRSAIIHHVASRLIVAAGTQATRPAVKRHRERLKALQPELAAIKREHPDDHVACLREAVKLCRRHRLAPISAATVATTGVLLAVNSAVPLVHPLRQGLPDIAARIATTSQVQ